MVQFRPRVASSRIWARCQIREPAPISARASTSAVGATVTPSRVGGASVMSVLSGHVGNRSADGPRVAAARSDRRWAFPLTDSRSRDNRRYRLVGPPPPISVNDLAPGPAQSVAFRRTSVGVPVHRVCRTSTGAFPPLRRSPLGFQNERMSVTPPPSASDDPIGIAVVGAGYWGPNLVRNFQAS